MKDNNNKIIEDRLGNELHVGDRVFIKQTGNDTRWVTGTISRLNPNERYCNVQAIYDSLFYYSSVPAYLMEKDNVHFQRKNIKHSISSFNVVLMKPEYIFDNATDDCSLLCAPAANDTMID